MAGFRPGQAVQCVSLAVTLEKEADRVGFKIGGGIDQDPGDCVFHYPDSVVARPDDRETLPRACT